MKFLVFFPDYYEVVIRNCVCRFSMWQTKYAYLKLEISAEVYENYVYFLKLVLAYFLMPVFDKQ